MSNKLATSIEDAVADTLFIPLYMRAKLTRENSPIIKDDNAVELCDRLDYNFDKYETSKISLTGCGVRADYFDKQCIEHINNAISNDRRLVVVSIGCGLDNRIARVKEQLVANGKNSPEIDWYDMDLPEVMALRKQVLPINQLNDSKPKNNHINQYYLDDSLLTNEWLETILENTLSKTTDVDFLFISEGVLLYFEEEQVKDLFSRMSDSIKTYFSKHNISDSNVPNVTIVFDTTASFGVKMSHKNDSLKHTDTGVRFKWAVEDSKVLEKWQLGYQLQNSINIMDLHKKEWPLSAKILGLLPMIRNNSRILTYRFCV